MNYYKRHLGDFARDCPNLSQGAVGAYTLLLDFYYANEAPLPLDRDELVRIARAFTAADRKALDSALRLFERTADGYRSKRADEEIAAYQAKAEVNRRNGPKGGRPKKEPNGNPQETQTVSETEPEKNLSQNPLASNPSDTSSHAVLPPAQPPVRACKPEGLATKLMRQAGCVTANSTHPDLLAAIDEGVTPETLGETAREAINAGHDVRRAFAYAIATARGRNADGARPTGASHAPAQRLSASEQVRAAIASRTGYAEHDVIDSEVRRIA